MLNKKILFFTASPCMEAANENDEFDAEEQMLLEDASGDGVGESMGSGGVDVKGPRSHIDTTTSTAAATSGGLRKRFRTAATCGRLRKKLLSVPERICMRK